MMSHQELRELCELYALDALAPEEARAFEAHLDEGCPECARQLAELRTVTAGLGWSVPQVELGPGVKADLMARVASSRAARPARPGWRAAFRTPRVWIPLTATAAIVAVLGWQTFTLRQVLDEQRVQLTVLTERLESQQELTRLLASAPIINLSGTEAGPNAVARVLWDTDEKVWHFYVSNLAPLAEDRTYQLWFLTDEERRSAGIFRPDDAGSATLEVPVPSDLVGVGAAAVSLEPAGGVPQPTGPIVLFGSV